MDYLQQHKDTLIPEFRQVWEAAGFKTSGTWEEVFGKSAVTDGNLHGLELCALHRPGGRGGQGRIPDTDVRERGAVRNSEGASATTGRAAAARGTCVMDIWKAGAPRHRYALAGQLRRLRGILRQVHPAREPAVHTRGAERAVGAARVLYAFGRHDAIGFSAMGPSRGPTTPDTDLIGSYDMLAQLTPLILEHQGNGTMSAVLLGPNDPPQKVRVGNYTLEAAFMKPRDRAC